MAISKERLEELIEQGATIYKIRDGLIIDYSLCAYNYIDGSDLIYENVLTNYCKNYVGLCEDLYETKEDAEFALEFQNIPHTTYLSLPTWKEIKKLKSFMFYSGAILYCLEVSKQLVFIYKKANFPEILFQEKRTKENYLKMCSICKQLFLKGDKR